MTEQEWEPGDPLPGYFRHSVYQGYFYNFRDTELLETDTCRCPDRASWPEPLVKELPSEEWFINYFKTQLGIENG